MKYRHQQILAFIAGFFIISCICYAAHLDLEHGLAILTWGIWSTCAGMLCSNLFAIDPRTQDPE